MRNRGMRTPRGRSASIAAAVAALGTAGLAAGMVVTSAASAATAGGTANGTPACGASCFTAYSRLLGASTVLNAYVPGNTGAGGKTGQPVNLKYASNSSPNQDWTDYAPVNGIPQTVADFCDAWPAAQSFNPTSYVCQNYGSDNVAEFSWSPYGNESGLCAGVPSARNGEKVTLQPCGQTDGTLWISDTANCTPRPVLGDRFNGALTSYVPLINGSDNSFSHPLVLTVDAGPARPGNQLKLGRENTLTGGAIRDSQLFAITGSITNGCTYVPPT